MDSPCKLEEFPIRFGSYIEELHQLFRNRSVGFGSPADVGPAVDRLRVDRVFADEMASMVRSIIYRQRDGLARVELLELLLVAIGGVKVDEDAEEIHEPVRNLHGFIEGVFRSRWNRGIEHEAQQERAEPAREPSAAWTAADVPAQGAEAAQETVAQRTSAERTSAEKASAEKAEAAPVEAYGTAPEAVDEIAAPPVPSAPSAVQPPVAALQVAESEPVPFVAEVRSPEEETGQLRFHADWAAVPAKAPVQAPVRWRLIWTGVAVLVLLAVFAGLTIGYEMHNTAPQVLDATQTYQPAKPVGQEPAPERHGAAKSKLRSGKSPATTGEHPFQVYGGEQTRTDSTRSEEAMTARPPEVSLSAAKAAEDRPPAAVSRRPAPRADYAEPEGYGSIVPGTIGVSPAMMQGRLLFNPLPMYPQLARVAHIQGKVLVQALVGRDGRVHEADVVSGHHLLRAAAKRAVLERTYRPYTVNGHPVEVSTMVTVDFRLDDQD